MVVGAERANCVEGISKLLWEFDVPIDLPQDDFVDGLLGEGLIRQRVETRRQVWLVRVTL
jgi:hypothetical protein